MYIRVKTEEGLRETILCFSPLPYTLKKVDTKVVFLYFIPKKQVFLL
jgi:hypothetical protein